MINHIDIEQLLAKTALGDRKAFQKLYQSVSSKLFAIALKITKNNKLAEEVLQESFTKIWHKADSFDIQKAKPITWLGTITRNTAIDKIRKNNNQEKTQSFEEDNETSIQTQTPEMILIHSDIQKTIQACLNSIDSNRRNAVIMTYLDGYSNQQLSEKLDMPLGTIKSWIRRGLMDIKSCVQNDLHPPREDQ